MKKVLLTIIAILTVIMGTLAFVSCNVNAVRPDSDDKSTTGTGASAGQTEAKGIASADVNEKGELILTFTDGTSVNLGVVTGSKGDKGDKGDQGENGQDGKDGQDGKSAYEIWLESGNSGSEADFLEWLKGQKGEKGDKGDKGDPGSKGDKGNTGSKGDKGDKGDQGENGQDGKDGQDGKSAYEIWLDGGYDGTEADFLEWLKGKTGDRGEKGDQGEKGDKGDQGDKGDKGEAGRGIASMEINDKGELIVTYTDGTSENLGVTGGQKRYIVRIYYVGDELWADYSDGISEKISVDGSSACTHENAAYVEQVAHKMNPDGTFTNGIYQMICPDCNMSKTISDVRHAFITRVSEPDCMSDGYTWLYCPVCEYITDKEKTADALGHDFVLSPPGSSMEENKKWCEEGGLSIEVCSRCNTIGEYVTISPENARGHHSDEWTIENEPTWIMSGTIVGVCKVCKNNVEKIIPSCSNEAYTISDIRPEGASCGAEKTGTFTIKIDEQKIAIENVAIPGEMHTFKGEKINYEEVMIFKDKAEFDASGLQLTGNSGNLSCAYSSKAWFTCDKCGEVILLDVKQRHAAGDESGIRIITPATCEASGEKEIDCKTCNKTITESIPAVGHDYAYEVNAEDGVIIGICQNIANGKVSSCENPYVIYDNLKNIETEVVMEATCKRTGLIRYTLYKKDGKVIIFEAVEKQLDHLLLRADKTTERISDAVKYSLSLYPEIKPYGNAVKSCKSPFGGSFVCEECREMITVVLYISHTIKTGTYTNSPATCIKDGTESYYCTACEENIVDKVYEKASGHEYNWTIVDKENSEDGKYHLIGECCREFENNQGAYELCKDEGYKLDYVSVEPITCEILIRSTCQKQGKSVYTITKSSGTTEKIVVNAARVQHVLNGKKVSYYKPFPVTTKGVKLFGNSEGRLTCDGGAVGGYFVCEKCDEVISIMVIKPHTPPVEIAEGNEQKPTCTKEGWIKYDCTVCETKGVVETVEPLGHDYKRTIIDKADSEDGKYHLIGVCQRERTNENGVLAPCEEDGCRTEHVSDEPITEEIIEVTCGNDGKRIYTLVENGKTQTIVDIIPRTGIHDLNGLKIDENKVMIFADSNEFAATGLRLLGNTTPLSCASASLAYFTCENDGMLIVISVRLAHTPDESAEGVCAICGQNIEETNG